VQPRLEASKVEELSSAVSRLQEDLATQKTIAEGVARENAGMRQQLEKLVPVVEFVNSFDNPEDLKTIFDSLADDYSSEDVLKSQPLQQSPKSCLFWQNKLKHCPNQWCGGCDLNPRN
jgi:hypothetical protein